MEVKNIHENAGWYASYDRSDQGRALIECQSKKIKQYKDLIENLKGEIELADTPKEYSERMILDSIRALINDIPEVQHIEGYFKWVG